MASKTSTGGNMRLLRLTFSVVTMIIALSQMHNGAIILGRLVESHRIVDVSSNTYIVVVEDQDLPVYLAFCSEILLGILLFTAVLCKPLRQAWFLTVWVTIMSFLIVWSLYVYIKPIMNGDARFDMSNFARTYLMSTFQIVFVGLYTLFLALDIEDKILQQEMIEINAALGGVDIETKEIPSKKAEFAIKA